LCVNTSFNTCSINLASEEKNIICNEDKNNPPSDVISILVKESLKSASLKMNDISGIITILGPGNYTSIRVGIAFSLGLSKSKSIPIYGISALEAISISQSRILKKNESLLVSVKAVKDEFFFQVFNYLSEPLSKPIKSKLSDIEELLSNRDLILIGPGSSEIKGLIDIKNKIIEVKDYIDYQKVLTHIRKKSDQYNNIVPLYLSDPLAEKKDISWFVKKEI
jgi:tRNA threonylcarbamoyl adenosine modification protein YeaZ